MSDEASAETRPDDEPLLDRIPHSRTIGMRIVDVGGGRATLRVPWREDLVGDPDTGVLHGGVITSLLDNASGMAVSSALEQARPIATLDLRIDYMKPAVPGEDVLGRAECYKVTRSIAFVRGVAYHDDPADPVATTVATFMLTSLPTPGREDGG